eukprot:1073884-Pelagomonas_calceolata.AAC.1
MASKGHFCMFSGAIACVSNWCRQACPIQGIPESGTHDPRPPNPGNQTSWDTHALLWIREYTRMLPHLTHTGRHYRRTPPLMGSQHRGTGAAMMAEGSQGRAQHSPFPCITPAAPAAAPVAAVAAPAPAFDAAVLVPNLPLLLTLTQIPHPMHSSSEIHAIFELGFTSIHSFPASKAHMARMHTCSVRASSGSTGCGCMQEGVQLLVGG